MIKRNITISVLMSIYEKDVVENVKAALESIYDDQTLKPNEVVIVLDGPVSPKMHELVYDFQKKRNGIKVIPLNENIGLGNALNIGLKQCKYDYIARMDADDISLPTRFEVQSRFAKKHPEIDVFGTYITEFGFTKNNQRVRKVPSNHNAILKMLKKRNSMNHVSVFIKRDKLNDISGYVEIPLLEDYYLWIRMFEADYKFANIPQSLVMVRTDESFNSKRSDVRRISGWWKLQKKMQSIGMINKIDSIFNMINIVGFTFIPKHLKTFIYSKFLRDNT